MAFEFFEKLGVPFFAFHDRDVAPEGATLKESHANLDEVGYRNHGHRWRYRYFYGNFAGIDREARQVIVAPLHDEDGTELISAHRIRYDFLVLAIGAISNDFGTTGAREHCLFLDDREQADRFRHRLLNHCLRVSRHLMGDPAADPRVEVAIVGGGATGVELAAELFNAAAAPASRSSTRAASRSLCSKRARASSRCCPRSSRRRPTTNSSGSGCACSSTRPSRRSRPPS